MLQNVSVMLSHSLQMLSCKHDFLLCCFIVLVSCLQLQARAIRHAGMQTSMPFSNNLSPYTAISHDAHVAVPPSNTCLQLQARVVQHASAQRKQTASMARHPAQKQQQQQQAANRRLVGDGEEAGPVLLAGVVVVEEEKAASRSRVKLMSLKRGR
jgi:hypothetical protein